MKWAHLVTYVIFAVYCRFESEVCPISMTFQYCALFCAHFDRKMVMLYETTVLDVIMDRGTGQLHLHDTQAGGKTAGRETRSLC
jgi:hypothetical protein